MRDELFKSWSGRPFDFDEEVAAVFDDMISRSVPGYEDNLRLSAQLLARLLPAGAGVCDLGCASGSFLLFLAGLRRDLFCLGVDNSPSMLGQARAKLAASPFFKKNEEKKFDFAGGASPPCDPPPCGAFLRPDPPVPPASCGGPFPAALGSDCDPPPCGAEPRIHFIQADLNDFVLASSSWGAISSHYTLQFISPGARPSLLGRVFEALVPGGIFVLSEKITHPDPVLNDALRAVHEDFKASRGYSRLEIAAKRQALENILIPHSEAENIALLRAAGFARVECIFKWANFISLIAFKD